MLPSKSREHRMRVLQNQAKVAAERDAPVQNQTEAQLKMPLIVEVKRSESSRQRGRRARAKSPSDQPGLGDL